MNIIGYVINMISGKYQPRNKSMSTSIIYLGLQQELDQ